MSYYPPFDEKVLWAIDVIRQQVENDPEYLDHPDCPYLPKSKEVLRRIIRPQRIAEEWDVETKGLNKWEKLELETTRLFEDLKRTKEDLSIDDHAGQMAYFRTATSLMDKIVGLQERAMGVKKIHQFQQTVLDIMEDVLDAGQRTEVMERLKKAISEDSE